MKTKTIFGYLDPKIIMSVVVSLVLLGVGLFAFFTTMSSLTLPYSGATPLRAPGNWSLGWPNHYSTFSYNQSYYSLINVTDTGTQVGNIVGIVIVIGAIMSIVGIIYAYVRR